MSSGIRCPDAVFWSGSSATPTLTSPAPVTKAVMRVASPPPPKLPDDVSTPRQVFFETLSQYFVHQMMSQSGVAEDASDPLRDFRKWALPHLETWGYELGLLLASADPQLGLPEHAKSTDVRSTSPDSGSERAHLDCLGCNLGDNFVYAGRKHHKMDMGWHDAIDVTSTDGFHVLIKAVDRVLQYERLWYALETRTVITRLELPYMPDRLTIREALGYIYAFIQSLPAAACQSPNSAAVILESGIREIERIAAKESKEFDYTKMRSADGKWLCWKGRKGEVLLLGPQGVVYRGTFPGSEDLGAWTHDQIQVWVDGNAQRMRLE